MSTEPAQQAHKLPFALGWRYGLLGFPLAFMALPLYVHLPHYYAQNFGLSLTLLGIVLLWTRGLDALLDPYLGRWLDRVFTQGSRAMRAKRLSTLALVCAVLLIIGFALLWWPQTIPWASLSPSLGLTLSKSSGVMLGLLTGLVLSYLAYSVLSILHQSWGARMGGNAQVRSRVAAWREAYTLLGVVLASVLVSSVDMIWVVALLGLGLFLALWALRSSTAFINVLHSSALEHTSDHAREYAMEHPREKARETSAQNKSKDKGLRVQSVWRNPHFRRLMMVFALNGIASAIPATLLPFYVADALGATNYLPLFLMLYFLCAALSIPLWLRALAQWSHYQASFQGSGAQRPPRAIAWLVQHDGLVLLWLLAMLLSTLAFVCVLGLSSGNIVGFALICMLTGLALGADLAMPSAILTGLIQKAGHAGQAEGQYYGWWSCLNKLNLALAAGISLPLLETLGYQAGKQAPATLSALTIGYVLLPCLLKVSAGLLLWRFSTLLGPTPRTQQ